MSSGFESMTADMPQIGPKKKHEPPWAFRCEHCGSENHLEENCPSIKTPPLPDRPSEEPERAAAPEGDGSPSAVEQHEIALTQEWARLIAELPNVKFAEGVAVSQRRFIQAEMERVRRLLAVHKRLREPIRRRK